MVRRGDGALLPGHVGASKEMGVRVSATYNQDNPEVLEYVLTEILSVCSSPRCFVL